MRKLLGLILLVVTLFSVTSCGRQKVTLKDNEHLTPEALQAEIIEHAVREHTAIADPDILRIDTWKRVSSKPEQKGITILLMSFDTAHDDYYIRIFESGIEAYDYSAPTTTEYVCYYSVPDEIIHNIRMAIRKYQREHPGEEFDMWV